MNDPMQKLRQTGRTTRMLNAAVMCALEGNIVIVIAPDKDLARDYRRLIEVRRAVLGSKEWWSIRVRAYAEISHNTDYVFDWERLGFRGPIPVPRRDDGPCWNMKRLPNTPITVLVDHYIIERKFGAAIMHMHQFDLEGS